MKDKGVTFIELILILAIMLTLSIMAPIFYSRFLLQNSTVNAADQLVGSLRKAQMYSIMSKQADSWSVHFASNTITLYKGSDFNTRNNSFDETFSVNPNVSINLSSDITFARRTGLPSVTPTITISSPGNNTEQITVNSQGVVSR